MIKDSVIDLDVNCEAVEERLTTAEQLKSTAEFDATLCYDEDDMDWSITTSILYTSKNNENKYPIKLTADEMSIVDVYRLALFNYKVLCQKLAKDIPEDDYPISALPFRKHF